MSSRRFRFSWEEIGLILITIVILFYWKRKFYYLLINGLCLLAFVYDKHQSMNRRYRVSESLLLGFSALGGSIGGLVAMLLLQHKLRKISFVAMFLLSAVAHLFFVFKIQTWMLSLFQVDILNNTLRKSDRH